MKRKGRGKAKGSGYERLFCVNLSRWYSRNKREDLFWRTAGSGARATVRGRKGKTTGDHAGDICAIHPKGNKLISIITWEVKRGYPRTALHDLLSKPRRKTKSKQEDYRTWIRQAQKSSKNARTPYWAVVHKHDKKEELMIIPMSFYNKIREEIPFDDYDFMFARIEGVGNIIVLKLADFFTIDPRFFRRLK